MSVLREGMRGKPLLRLSFTSILVVVLASCSSGSPGTTTSQSGPPVTPPPGVSPTSTTISLNARPLYWFAPLPPLPTDASRPFTGSDDFMSLFEPDAPWQNAAAHIQVFKLYGEWVAYQASDAQLKQAVMDIQRRGMALAVEAGPLDPPANCGQGVESFAGIQEGEKIANRIKAAGGTITFLALDEPYFFAHVYDGPNACRWPAERVAGAVGGYVKMMRSLFPGVIVGDTEPLSGPAGADAYTAWIRTFRSVNGYDLAFLHVDVDWSRLRWPQEVKSIEAYGRRNGVEVGIIYTGNAFDTTDEGWLSAAGERVKRYELESGGRPAHVIFQSWNDKPDHVLPETQAFTFTAFIDAYFGDKSSLGYRREGTGANLALGRHVRVSVQLPDHPGSNAVDGDPGTFWGAGAGPVQWIEVDLGAAHDIAEIRLIPSQYPDGVTTHAVMGKGPGTDGVFILLHTFKGPTRDGQTLTFAPATPWRGIRTIRILTSASPSWVAWREIEVIDAGP